MNEDSSAGSSWVETEGSLEPPKKAGGKLRVHIHSLTRPHLQSTGSKTKFSESQGGDHRALDPFSALGPV